MDYINAHKQYIWPDMGKGAGRTCRQAHSARPMRTHCVSVRESLTSSFRIIGGRLIRILGREGYRDFFAGLVAMNVEQIDFST